MNKRRRFRCLLIHSNIPLNTHHPIHPKIHLSILTRIRSHTPLNINRRIRRSIRNNIHHLNTLSRIHLSNTHRNRIHLSSTHPSSIHPSTRTNSQERQRRRPKSGRKCRAAARA